jgi:hypothetical protein
MITIVRKIKPSDTRTFRDVAESYLVEKYLYELLSKENSIIFISIFESRIHVADKLCRKISERYDEVIGVKEYKDNYKGEERRMMEFKIGSEDRDEVLRFYLYAFGTPANSINSMSEYILDNSLILDNYFTDETPINEDEVSDILPDSRDFSFMR